jgi:nucleotide-binding universal stress UspA family protein
MRYRPCIAKFEDANRDAHRNVLSEAFAKVKQDQPEIEVVTRLEKGRPSDVIVDTANEEDVDMIVMGSRGLGGITGWMIGSTCRGVIHDSKKPILVLK